jgi:nucleoid-associated protein YgaU|tara:strand:- start:574 stop:954 length:381 start_codon:yes stop_codon:yes gene_type:complete
MPIKAKYQDVLDLGEKLEISNGDVNVVDGVLKVKGTAKTQYEKNLMWDSIKAIGGDNPTDIMANISVADESVYHRHTVASGETLGGIAKHYFKNAMKYKEIFAANTNTLDNPDVIKVGQVLDIPNL